MKKILTILTVIAVMFTFSFGSAFAADAPYANDTVGKTVEQAIASVDFTKYLVKDAATIDGYKTTLIKATEKAKEYNAEVIKAIEEFKVNVAKIKTYDEQKIELTKERVEASTRIDNEIIKLTDILTTELKDKTDDALKQRYSTLTFDINTYKDYLKAKINKVEIVSNRIIFDKPEVDLKEATAQLDEIKIVEITKDNEINIELFYEVRDQLNKRPYLIAEAERVAKVMALEVKSNTQTREYSDKAIADVLASVKDKINVLEIIDSDTIKTEMYDKAITVDAESVTDLETYKTTAIASITTGSYSLTNWSGASLTAVTDIQKKYTNYISSATSKGLVDAYVSQAKAAMALYKTNVQIKEDNDKLTNLDKENKELADKLAKLELDKKITNLVAAQTDNLKCVSQKTKAGNIKITVKNFDATEIIANEYTIKYTYYRAIKRASNFKVMKIKNTKTYTNTSGKKGVKYFYKVKISIFDKNGNLITTTKLSDCKAAYRVR